MLKPLGYTFLARYFELELPQLGMELYQGNHNQDKTQHLGEIKQKVLAASKRYPANPSEHIEVAIKYQGIRLPYLAMIFERINVQELTNFIAARQTANIRRAIWYLYEWYTGERLALDDLKKTPYVDLMDSQYYFTRQQGEKCSRTKVINNMLGNRECCPMIRKTRDVLNAQLETIIKSAQEKLASLNELVQTEQLGRSINYLYLKETKSSTEIEREDSQDGKIQRFFQIVKSAGTIPLSKSRLLNIQNQIVPQNKGDKDYRQENIWVGQEVQQRSGGTYEDFHYIAPKFQHVPKLMQGLLNMHESLRQEPDIPALVHATVVSFMFVYIHPFTDGNGRTHRYLIHDILKSRLGSKDFVVPVSAAILKNLKKYDATLETLSKPIMAVLHYQFDEATKGISIENDINFMYQFPDLTPHALFLKDMLSIAIDNELIEEILYILTFDQIKTQLNNRFDLSEKDLSNYVNWLMQNNGIFATSKRKQVAKYHTNAVIDAMQAQAQSTLREHEEIRQKLAEM